jgi:uncharacterized protein (DUF1697 family)
VALVAFLRGVNVGGHKSFHPSVLAEDMASHGTVNVGAAGTFVIRRLMTRTKLRAELARRLPFATGIMICEGREILALAADDPFRKVPKRADVVRFVSVMARRPRLVPSIPASLPRGGAWRVKILAIKDRFAIGVYRRQMETIGHLGKIDGLLGVPVTTRNWNTIAAVIKVLRGAPE